MPKDKKMPSDTVKVIAMLKLDNGVVIDAEELNAEQREAYIEFAVHLVAPRIAKLLSEGLSEHAVQETHAAHVINEEFFSYPPMIVVLPMSRTRISKNKLSPSSVCFY